MSYYEAAFEFCYSQENIDNNKEETEISRKVNRCKILEEHLDEIWVPAHIKIIYKELLPEYKAFVKKDLKQLNLH